MIFGRRTSATEADEQVSWMAWPQLMCDISVVKHFGMQIDIRINFKVLLFIQILGEIFR